MDTGVRASLACGQRLDGREEIRTKVGTRETDRGKDRSCDSLNTEQIRGLAQQQCTSRRESAIRFPQSVHHLAAFNKVVIGLMLRW